MIEDGAGFRTKGPQGGRGSRRQGGPGSRMWLLGEDSTLPAGPVGRAPARMEQAGVQLMWPWGLDPAWLFPALRAQSSPRLLLRQQRAGPELGRPSLGGGGRGGDVASTALAGRPAGLWEAWPGDSSELSGTGPSCSQSHREVPVLQAERGGGRPALPPADLPGKGCHRSRTRGPACSARP